MLPHSKEPVEDTINVNFKSWLEESLLYFRPLISFLEKIFKGCYCELYDEYMISAHDNNNGQPKPTSLQLCAQCVVKAREKIPESIVS